MATISGKVEGGSLTSGSKSATLHFPADAEVHITGTVKDNMSGLFAFPLPWELTPLTSGSVAKNSSSDVNETWTNTGGDEDLTVTFDDTSGFVSDYEWNLQLSSSGNGCLRLTPRRASRPAATCTTRTPTVVDGEQRQGCYKDDSSCINDIPTQLSATQCDPDDIFTKSLAASAGDASIVMVGGRVILFVSEIAADLTVGQIVVGAVLVVGVVAIGIAGYTLFVDLTTISQQGDAAVQADPGVVDDVMTRMPSLGDDNPGASTNEELEFAAKLAMATCIDEVAIDQVIPFLGAYGAAIDPDTGLVDIGGGVTRHICELFPVYLPGGSTAPGGVPITEASLHVRDVLFGEHNRPDTQSNNPSTPQPQWQILTNAQHPDDTTSKSWKN